MTTEKPVSQPERRKNLELRAIFDEVYAQIAPMLDTGKTWGGMPLEMLAYRKLRQLYPDLSSLSVYQFLVAARRMNSSSRASGTAPAIHA